MRWWRSRTVRLQSTSACLLWSCTAACWQRMPSRCVCVCMFVCLCVLRFVWWCARACVLLGVRACPCDSALQFAGRRYYWGAWVWGCGHGHGASNAAAWILLKLLKRETEDKEVLCHLKGQLGTYEVYTYQVILEALQLVWAESNIFIWGLYDLLCMTCSVWCMCNAHCAYVWGVNIAPGYTSCMKYVHVCERCVSSTQLLVLCSLRHANLFVFILHVMSRFAVKVCMVLLLVLRRLNWLTPRVSAAAPSVLCFYSPCPVLCTDHQRAYIYIIDVLHHLLSASLMICIIDYLHHWLSTSLIICIIDYLHHWLSASLMFYINLLSTSSALSISSRHYLQLFPQGGLSSRLPLGYLRHQRRARFRNLSISLGAVYQAHTEAAATHT